MLVKREKIHNFRAELYKVLGIFHDDMYKLLVDRKLEVNNEDPYEKTNRHNTLEDATKNYEQNTETWSEQDLIEDKILLVGEIILPQGYATHHIKKLI